MALFDAINFAHKQRIGEPLSNYLHRALYTSLPVKVAPGWSAPIPLATLANSSFRPFLSLGLRCLGWLGLAYTVYSAARSLTSGAEDSDAVAGVGSFMGLPRGTVESVARLASKHSFPGLVSRPRLNKVLNGAVGLYREIARTHGALRRLRASRHRGILYGR